MWQSNQCPKFSWAAILYFLSITLKHIPLLYKHKASLFNSWITSHFNILCPILPNGLLQINQSHIFLATSVCPHKSPFNFSLRSSSHATFLLSDFMSLSELSKGGKWISRACIEIYFWEDFTPCIYIARIIYLEYGPCIYIDWSSAYLLHLSIHTNFQDRDFTICQCWEISESKKKFYDTSRQSWEAEKRIPEDPA